jgi:hypothetical protein
MFQGMFQNLQGNAIKKHIFEMLGERYGRNERFVERLVSQVTTKEDYEGLGTFLADLFESGFVRAVNQYKDQFSKMGMKVSIVPEEKPKDSSSRIFGHSEKSG